MDIIKFWIARDVDNELTLFVKKPIESNTPGYQCWVSDEIYFDIDDNLFPPPEVTFENSPQQVEIKLVENYG